MEEVEIYFLDNF